ncbi:MAG TPA: hypothetical protein VLQ45_02570 [Thermoanaerobaculia bacterium]|nr:hypothetical protein [Thermoanaerobaculia bacterium]
MRVLRPFAVLLLVLALGASGAAASPAPRPAGLPEAEPSIRVPSLFVRLESFLAGLWSKEGCRVDPLGRCEPVAPATDAGCRLDPLGLCEPNQ